MKRKPKALPGFGITMGFTILYLSLIVLIPLSAVFIKTSSMGWHEFWQAVSTPRVIASYKVTLFTSVGAVVVDAFAGLLVAWVLSRYSFPGKRIIDALVDLPFALPTAVAGIALTSIYAGNGWIGKYLEPLGIKVVFTPIGIAIALAFVGFPFVVRSVQPVIEDLEPELEDAAACLGASRLQTFSRVIFPAIFPALLTGLTLAFARAIGEYGSVVFIAGNLPMKTEIPALLIVTKLEQYDYAGATAIASVMLVMSFIMLLAINLIQSKFRKYEETA